MRSAWFYMTMTGVPLIIGRHPTFDCKSDDSVCKLGPEKQYPHRYILCTQRCRRVANVPLTEGHPNHSLSMIPSWRNLLVPWLNPRGTYPLAVVMNEGFFFRTTKQKIPFVCRISGPHMRAPLLELPSRTRQSRYAIQKNLPLKNLDGCDLLRIRGGNLWTVEIHWMG